MMPYARKVQYYETDRMGVAHHANYLHWMEEARIDFLDQLGFPYAAMEEKDVLSTVKALSCEYVNPCTFGDRISVTVSVESFNGVVMVIRYLMLKEDGSVVCKARSEHVFLNREGHFVRMRKVMPAFCDSIEAVIRSISEGEEQDP